MDDQTKCEIYTKLLNSLNENGELEEETNKDTYNSRIQLIKTDLLSKVSSDQETALQMLKILIENNVLDIQQDVITILKDNNVDLELKTSIIDGIKNYIKDLLHSNNVINLASLYVYWKNYDLQKFYELLESASLQEPQNDAESNPINFANLIIEHVLPMMSSHSHIHLKQPLIEVATKIAKMHPISNLNSEEYQDVLKKVPSLLQNIVNLQKSNEDVWREPLHFLTEYLDEKLNSPEVQEMFSNSSLNWDLVRLDLESNINIELVKYISEKNLILTAMLYRGWKKLDPQKFTTALTELCQNNEYIKNCKTFFFEKLIPVIMAPKDMSDPMKVYYIDIALEFATSLPLTRLSNDEYNKFIGSVNDYIKNISDLRDMQFEHWHKLWIFLVRLFGKKLHHSMTLINRLLRVVEHAFRNPSFEQRIRGYDCWKELIDNVSLDSQHISSEKQIRLLLTPLRAKFSKQEAVIVKRFEIFVYLIEKLQDKAVLVLKEFLEFCFGEVGVDTDPNKSGQGKSLAELWPRSARVLLAMLGHSHDINERCLDASSELKLKGPVLNSSNISNHYCHTINSVAECCIILDKVELEQKNTVLKCFWTSLLRIALDENVAKKDKCLETLNKVLEKLLKDNDPYYNSIATELLKSTVKIDRPKALPFVLNGLEYFTKIIFSVSLDENSHQDIEKFQIMLCTVQSPEMKLKINNCLFSGYAEYQTMKSNANFVAQFWIFLVNELDDYAKSKCLDFLVWPALHIHHVTDSTKEVLIHERYEQVIRKFVEKSDELHLGLFKKFEKILKNNPLLVKNVFTLVAMFTPKTENKELINITLDILDLMMVVPAGDESNSQRQNLDLYLRKFYEINVTQIHDHITIKKLCTCLQHVLKFKHYDILTIVEATLKTLPENVKWAHGKFLSLEFLVDLFEKETDVSAAEKIHKLIDLFRNVKNPESKKDITSFMPLGGRSAKIAKLIKQTPPSPAKRSGSPTTLRLFGKDIETHSPLHLKGSQLKDTPTKAKTSTPTRKAKNTLCIDDESNSKFVLINTEVKLDKSKLTEHQKEALRKRREDIPALYQDLSQSMTQSHESNSVSGQIEDASIFKKPEEYDKEIKQAFNTEHEEEKCAEVSDKLTKQADVKDSAFNREKLTSIVNDVSKSTTSTSDTLETESKNEELSKTDLKTAAVEAELKKLSMSIVGADQFFATLSKRKRREKKRDLEENTKGSDKERKNKGSPAVKPKANKNPLSTPKQDAEDQNELLVTVNNEPEVSQDVQTKKQDLLKKIISNKLPTETLPGKPIQQVSTVTPDHNFSLTKTNKVEEKSDQSDPINTVEVDIGKGRLSLNNKANRLSTETSSSETGRKEENKKKLLSDNHKLLSGKRSFDKDINEIENELSKTIAEVKTNNEKAEIVPSVKTSEAFTKNEKDTPMKLANEHATSLTESRPATEGTYDTTKYNIVDDSTAAPLNKLLNKAESVIAEIQNADKQDPVLNTPKVTTKRGWPLGVSKKLGKRESPSVGQSLLRNKRELRPQTPGKIVIHTDAADIDKDSSVESCTTPSKDDGNSDNKKHKRKRGRPKGVQHTISKDDDHAKSIKISLKAKRTEIDVYNFDTEQEKASESEITPLRSPNKDDKLLLTTKDKINLPVTRKLVIPEVSALEGTPVTGRKSKRKSIPTEKFTQSELFKLPESTIQTPGSSKPKKNVTPAPKDLHAKRKESKKGNLPIETSTQSEIFKPTNEEELFDISDIISKPTDSGNISETKEFESFSDTVKQTDAEMSNLQSNDIKSDIPIKTVVTEKCEQPIVKNANPKSTKNTFSKAVKRKRCSSDEDEDIIESSQDSTSSRDSGAKLKLSLTRRLSLDKSLVAEIKQNIEKSEEIVEKALLDEVDINKDTPEDTKRKRGRPAKVKTTTPEKKRRGRPSKSPLKNDAFVAEANVSKTSLITSDYQAASKFAVTQSRYRVTKTEVTPEGTKQTLLKIQNESKEQTQSCNDITTIGASPEERKGKRGRPRKSPAKSDEIFETSSESLKSNHNDIEESQSLVSSGGKRFDANDETMINMKKYEDSKSPRLRRKTKAELEVVLPSILESTKSRLASVGESKPHRKRRRKNTEANDLEDGHTSEDSTVHVFEAIDKVSPGTISFNESPKRNKRKSPLKTRKEWEQPTQDLIQGVKKQIFSDKFKEPLDLDISTENLKQRTQSQDTQTQDTEPIDVRDEIQLQLDLPQKPKLNESDQEIARMDTASLSLGNFEELKGFNVSSSDETGMENNKTITENKTLLEDTAESKDAKQPIALEWRSNVIINDIAMIENKITSKDETLKNDLTESESVIGSTEEVNELTESNMVTEVAATEVIDSAVLVTMDVQQVVEVENSSPVKEQTADQFIGTPGPLESSLPSSPVTGDTPNRTSELLNCTSDISPIGSKSSSDKSSSDDEFVEQRKLVPIALKFDETPDQEGNKDKSPEKADDAPEKVDETSPEKSEKNVDKATSNSPPKDEAKTHRDVKNIAERSSRFFDMVNTGSPGTLRLFNKRKSGLNMSPSTSRIKKLMSNVKAPSQSEINDIVSQEDILTFTREVPSPLAVPKSSILKRKHSDTTDDGLSPCPKRKRVNFCDPCTTSKKVFIKEDNSSTQCLLGANLDEDIDKQFLEVLAANNIETPQTESDVIETEQSLQINNPMLLRDNIPIYPDLVDCEESVSIIARKLTSPMFVNAFLSKLNSRNIKSVGDLARESEVSIARLPFKTPMVDSVYKALDNYYHKNFKSRVNKEKHETKINGEVETSNEITEPLSHLESLSRLKVTLVKMDVKDELLKILERAKSQSMSDDTLCSVLLSAVDEKAVLKFIKSHSTLESKDILEEKDFSKVVKHITETVGLPKIFEILTESLKTSEDQSVYFDCMNKHSIDKKPLTSIIEKRSLQELQAALWENVENKTYTKKQLLDTCFLPFVNSIDLTPLFSKMTLVQIEEIVVTRLKTEDYPVFINKVLKKCSSTAEIKEQILSHCTVSELTSNIIKKGSPQEVMSSFTYMFLSAEKSKDDLVQIFRLVSDSLITVLPPTKLMELSIEFQKKIPIKD